jgi:hypothetical protein
MIGHRPPPRYVMERGLRCKGGRVVFTVDFEDFKNHPSEVIGYITVYSFQADSTVRLERGLGVPIPRLRKRFSQLCKELRGMGVSTLTCSIGSVDGRDKTRVRVYEAFGFVASESIEGYGVDMTLEL